MSFIISGQTVLSFAEFQDVVDIDQRLFEANEGLTDDVVEDLLIRSTERILTELRATDWWRSYYKDRDSSRQYNTVADIPALDPTKILARQNDFTDLCVFKALGEYILPKIADFGTEENAERQKMGYYVQKSTALFNELVTAGDWYDFSGDGTIVSDEKSPGQINLRRVR
jgi:hypothetical protein